MVAVIHHVDRHEEAMSFNTGNEIKIEQTDLVFIP